MTGITPKYLRIARKLFRVLGQEWLLKKIGQIDNIASYRIDVTVISKDAVFWEMAS